MYLLGVGLANLPHTTRAHAHNRPYTLALIPTRPSGCTQNSGRAFIFVGSNLFSLSRASRRELSLFLPTIFLTVRNAVCHRLPNFRLSRRFNSRNFQLVALQIVTNISQFAREVCAEYARKTEITTRRSYYFINFKYIYPCLSPDILLLHGFVPCHSNFNFSMRY